MARLLGLLLTLLAGVGVALALPLLTAAGRSRTVRGWFRLLLRVAGVRLRVFGSDRLSDRPGTLIAANHVSWLDIPAILAVEPVTVLAKSDVRRWPVIGLMAARAGTIFVDRCRLRTLPTTVAQIADALRRGRSVLVFPEGSTWCGRTRGRFHPATFQAAIDAQAPVRPVALRYRLADGTPTTAAAFVGDDTLVAAVLRVVAVRGLVVEVDAAPVRGPRARPAGARRLGVPRSAARRELGVAAAAALHRGVEAAPVLAGSGRR